MTPPPMEKYECLSGIYWAPLGPIVQELWLGETDILLRLRQGYAERLKRFALKDVHCLTFTGTTTGSVISLISALACLTFVGLFLIARSADAEDSVYLTGVGALISAMILTVNVALGPTCRCHLHTATHAQRLTCLSRSRRARRVLHTLARAIDAAQSERTQEQTTATPGDNQPKFSP